MNFKKINYWLVLILILAAGLRFWQLGLVPPAPDWDEAALGYNAYSLTRTGADEYGQKLPLVLRSFDDYKPAVYAYLAILPIKIFGLNVFAVRLPAALLGTLAVLLTYYLVSELFYNSQLVTRNREIALLTSFLLAISPWHLQFSRVAFETNVGLFFSILWVWVFLKALIRPRLLMLAAFLAGLNIYVYQAEKVFTPFLVLVLVLIWRREVFNLPKKHLVGAILVGCLMVLPLVILTLKTPDIFLRAKGTSVTADQTPFLAQTVNRLVRDQQNGDWAGVIFDNRRVTYVRTFLAGYLAHFDLNWLFITGDQPRHHAPGVGLMYLVELPFLLLGIYQLAFGRLETKAKWLVLGWLLIAPIPASFSTGVPHAVRTIRMLPTIQLITALGLTAFVIWLKNLSRILKITLILFFTCFIVFNFGYYLNQYFVQQNIEESQVWQYGYQEAVEEVKQLEPRYDRIIVSNEPHLDQSYMFFLFYLQYDPKKYQQEGGTVSGGFAETHRGFDKYTFRPIDWHKEEKNRTLFIGRPQDFPGGVKILKTIYFLDGQEAIKIAGG